MVDLSPALNAFQRRRDRAPEPQPVNLRATVDDVLERSSFLEFCEGLDRSEADSQALAEFGFSSFDELTPDTAPQSSKERRS